MNALYTLNTDDLNETFLQTVQMLFPHKMVKVTIHEVTDHQIPEYLTTSVEEVQKMRGLLRGMDTTIEREEDRL
ncbi:hypothetical protein CCP3SC1AL1_1260003 [Gammaproteobacteria bacterium]